ncbi:MAG: 6-carboxytetrahydropterin synthase QueD [Desulfotalea sp.]
MFDIFIKTHFSGGHHLRDYPGDCEKPHGHNWKIKVTARATELDKLGMALDFTILKKEVKKVIEQLDHNDLNNLPYFLDKNPSSENIAIFIFDNLKPVIEHERYGIYSVEVRETDNQGCTYYGK